MSSAILIAWFTITNHYMRGKTEPGLWGKILNKYTWAVISGLLIYTLKGDILGYNPLEYSIFGYNPLTSAITFVAATVFATWKGAEFTITHTKEKRFHWFIKACIRGAFFIPLMLLANPNLLCLITAPLCAISYAACSAVINPFYDSNATGLRGFITRRNEAISQTLFGLSLGVLLCLQ